MSVFRISISALQAPWKVSATLMALAFATLSAQGCTPRRFNASESDAASKKKKASQNEKPSDNGTLVELESDIVPLEEISGLLRWQGAASPKKERILAFSDRTHVVATFDANEKSGARDFQLRDLSDALRDFGDRVESDSQWEAAATDGEGTLFLLKESLSVINVFSADLSKAIHRIDLDVPKSHPLYDDWQADSNSRGEGLLLLKNGHFLVAKEKNPAALVEFGPAGDAALGLEAASRLGGTEAFQFPTKTRATYVPLKVWLLTKESEEAMPDISEITLTADGTLYLLSDKTQSIARLEADLKANEDKARVEEVWKLPKDVVQPEGLVLLDDFSPLVGIDAKEQKVNLFTFKALR